MIDALGSYLPLLVMALLALGSWWLVKNTPLPETVPGQKSTTPGFVKPREDEKFNKQMKRF